MNDECIERCATCINSRTIVSENGYHSICTLSSKAAINCMTRETDSYFTIVSKKEEKNDN